MPSLGQGFICCRLHIDMVSYLFSSMFKNTISIAIKLVNFFINLVAYAAYNALQCWTKMYQLYLHNKWSSHSQTHCFRILIAIYILRIKLDNCFRSGNARSRLRQEIKKESLMEEKRHRIQIIRILVEFYSAQLRPTSHWWGEKCCKQRCATWLPLTSFINETIPGFKDETTM